MSRAIAVFHGQFGRATLYELNRPFNVHAHREGHLIFQVGGASGHVDVAGKRCPVTRDTAVAISPWEPHNFVPSCNDAGGLFLVFYVAQEWFASGSAGGKLFFGGPLVARTPTLSRQIEEAAALLCDGRQLRDIDRVLRRLIDICFELSWRQAEGRSVRRAMDGVIDFRVRKSMRLMEEAPCADTEFDSVARESGLSRPHFYKLFRTHTGLTPNLFLNTIMMERALDRLVGTRTPVAEVGFDLGFSSQSGFTKFFAANAGMAPSDYRRAALIV